MRNGERIFTSAFKSWLVVIRCGEKVAFEDKYLNTVVGTIVRINQRTATIDPGDVTSWRVGFGLLRHALDI